MKLVAPSDLAPQFVRHFGLCPENTPAHSVAFLAAALRHAASRRCPCSHRVLVEAVLEAVAPLTDSGTGDLRDAIENVLEAVVAHGDLIECRMARTRDGSADEGDEDTWSDCGAVPRGRALLYLAPPIFVRHESGSMHLCGMLPDEAGWPAELQEQLCHRAHGRYVPPAGVAETLPLLQALGFSPRSEAQWLKSPPTSSPQDLIQLWDNRLQAVSRCGEMPDLEVIHPEKPVRYYRGRWSRPDDLTGKFVGRRQQRFGAPLWCYIELQAGQPQRFVDLPHGASEWRGCDEAWRLQAALDAHCGTYQVAEVELRDAQAILRLFGPVPGWVQRRWDALGERLLASGCLFAYCFDRADLQAEIDYLSNSLWTRTRVCDN